MLCIIRGLICWCCIKLIALATFAAICPDKYLLIFDKVDKYTTIIIIIYNCPTWNFYYYIFAFSPIRKPCSTLHAVFSNKLFFTSKAAKCSKPRIYKKNYIAAITTRTTIRTTIGDIRLSSKTYSTWATMPCFYFKTNYIYKFFHNLKLLEQFFYNKANTILIFIKCNNII